MKSTIVLAPLNRYTALHRGGNGVTDVEFVEILWCHARETVSERRPVHYPLKSCYRALHLKAQP